MARIRSIKPDFTQNENLSALPPETHLLALGLICYADDEGFFNANPKLIQAAIFPVRELLGNVPEMLRSLSGVGYLEFFDGTDGKHYGRVVKFLEHQKVSHAAVSKIKPLRNIPESLLNPQEPLRPELNRGGIEVELKGDEIPEQHHPLEYAHRMIELLSLASSFKLKEIIAAAVVAEAKYQGIELDEASQYIANRAMADRAKGVAIDKFYFEDTKWRTSNGTQPAVSKAVTRAANIHTSIDAGMRQDLSRRTKTDGVEREDRTRRVLGG